MTPPYPASPDPRIAEIEREVDDKLSVYTSDGGTPLDRAIFRNQVRQFFIDWLTASEQARQEAARERDVYTRAFACCEIHTPDLWEGGRGCLICEAVNDFDKLQAAEQRASEAEQQRDKLVGHVASWREPAGSLAKTRDAIAAKLAEAALAAAPRPTPEGQD
jgi:hypothetical protein